MICQLEISDEYEIHEDSGPVNSGNAGGMMILQVNADFCLDLSR
jgi:hypothetical protein